MGRHGELTPFERMMTALEGGRERISRGHEHLPGGEKEVRR